MRKTDMPTRKPNAANLYGSGVAPLQYTHYQVSPSATWTVDHNFMVPGTIRAVAYDNVGLWIPIVSVQADNENRAILTFSGPVSGKADVFAEDAAEFQSIRVLNQIDLNGAELTAGAQPGQLLLNNSPLMTMADLNGEGSLAPILSPTFTGIPAAPTAPPGTNTAQIATTAYVRANKSPVLNIEGGLGWKDLTSELVARGGGAAAPALALFRGNIYAYQFAANSNAQLYSTFHVPHDYAPGTSVFFHMHWADASAVPSGVVRWGFEYTYAHGHGRGAFPAPTTLYVEQSATAQYQHMVAEIPDGVLGGVIEVDGIILVRIFRDTASPNDTSSAGVFAFTCDLHYQADRFATLNRAPNFYGA